MVSTILIAASAKPACGKIIEIFRRSRRLSANIRPQISYRGPRTSGARDKGKKMGARFKIPGTTTATLPPTPKQTQTHPCSRQPGDLPLKTPPPPPTWVPGADRLNAKGGPGPQSGPCSRAPRRPTLALC